MTASMNLELQGKVLVWQILSDLFSCYKESGTMLFFLSSATEKGLEFMVLSQFPGEPVLRLKLTNNTISVILPKSEEVISPDTPAKEISSFLADSLGFSLPEEREELYLSPYGFAARLFAGLYRILPGTGIDADIRSACPYVGEPGGTLEIDPFITQFPFIARNILSPERPWPERLLAANRYWTVRFSGKGSGKVLILDTEGQAFFWKEEIIESTLYGEIFTRPLWLQKDITETVSLKIKGFLGL